MEIGKTQHAGQYVSSRRAAKEGKPQRLIDRLLFWFNWNVQAKILSIIAVVMFLILAALLPYEYVALSEQVENSAGKQLLVLGDEIIQQKAGELQEKSKTLSVLAMAPDVLTLVDQQNRLHSGLKTDKIEAMDQAWKDNDAVSLASTEAEIINNNVSLLFTSFMNEFPEQMEIFLTDSKGLNIAMTGRTSDYLQADEKWWQETYSQKAIFLDEVDYDESTPSYGINVGVPVFDERKANVIGVLRGTIDITQAFASLHSARFQQRRLPGTFGPGRAYSFQPQPGAFASANARNL